MRHIALVFVLILMVAAAPAAAKKRPIELEVGFFRWGDFSYSENPEYKKKQLRGSNIVNRWGGWYLEYDREVVTYDGDSTLRTDRAFRVVMAAESSPERFYVARIDPSLGEELEIQRIVLERKGKPDVEYSLEDLYEEAADSWFDYYDSDRDYYVLLPQDEADATLDVEISVVTRSQPGFEGFVQFGDTLQSFGVCQERTLTFRYPVDHPLYLKPRGFEARLKPRRDGDMEEVTLSLRQLYPTGNERWSAHAMVNYPSILASSHQNWDEYHRLVHPVFEEKIVADDTVRAEVARLTDGLQGEREKADAIYRFVAADLHYLGMYVGEGGWIPHAAPEVLESRFGDCKDHSILLTTMLREAGIEAWPTLIRAGRMGFVDDEFPFLFANHAIVYAEIDGAGVFLDGTTSPYRFDALSNANAGRTALVVGDQQMEFIDTPQASAANLSWVEDVELRILDDGSLEAEVEVTYGGGEAARLRDLFRTRPEAEVERLDRGWIARYYLLAEEATLTQEPDPASGSGPLQRTLTLRSTEHVRKLGSVMRLELPILELPGGIEASARAHNFPVWVTPLAYELHMTIHLPPGYQVVELPDDQRSIRPGGTIEVEFEQHGDEIRIDAAATWKQARVAAAAAESYAQFRTELAEVFDQALVLAKGGVR
jgi:transglutaminase-like putative cysteine protease